MAVKGKHHDELDENGVGKCSVPMWCMGCPVGFCDEPAYGKQIRNGNVNALTRPFCTGLACPNHGGPRPGCDGGVD